MKKYFYFAMALAFASCSNNEDWNAAGQDAEIRLSSGVVSSRAATQATQLVSGEVVHAWLDNVAGEQPTEIVKAWKLTADDSDKLTGETAQFFPEGVSSLKAYAVHANLDFENGTSLPNKITHSVLADQKETANYVKSDLLYSIKDAVKKGENNVLTFYHMLSKVEIKLIPGDGFTEEGLKDAKVSILGTKPVATLTLNKARTENELSELSARNGMIEASGASTPISIATKLDDYAEAAIVPQSVQGDFIQLELANLALTYKLDTEKTFESGKKYQFDITVKKTGLKVTATITDWDSTSGPVSGSATMREFSNIEKALKANDLLSGAVRDADGEFKAYYFFDETFQNITSYVIGETNDKKDITVTTQPVTVSDDKNTASWATPFVGLTQITLQDGKVTVAGDVVLDANENGVSNLFDLKKYHLRLEIDRATGVCKRGDMSRLFEEEVMAHSFDFIEINKDWHWDLVIYATGYTFYKTKEISRLSKDEVWMKNDNLECENGMDADKANTELIKGLLESFYDVNIVVKAKAGDEMDVAPYYIINKAGKGWFLFDRKTEG